MFTYEPTCGRRLTLGKAARLRPHGDGKLATSEAAGCWLGMLVPPPKVTQSLKRDSAGIRKQMGQAIDDTSNFNY